MSAANGTTPRMVTISEDDLSTLLDAACEHADWLHENASAEAQFYDEGEYERMEADLEAARLRARRLLFPGGQR
jgi:hypothetical protein